MPAMSLICGEFVKSLLIPADATSRVTAAAAASDTNGSTTNGNGLSHEDSDVEDENDVQHEATLGVRKALLERNAELEVEQQQKSLSTDVVDQQTLDHRLKLITGLKKQLRLSM